MPNIIEIIKKSEDDKLEVGATLSFNIEFLSNPLKVGDGVHFKIVEYENFKDIIMTTNCVIPKYAAIIEFCNK